MQYILTLWLQKFIMELEGLMKFRRGMTLAEVLMVFIIIGIVATYTVCSARPWEKSYKYAYSRIYNALQSAIYNDSIDNLGFPSTTEAFCQGLIKYINTVDTAVEQCVVENNVKEGPRLETQDEADDVFTPRKSIVLSNGMKIWIGGNDSNGPFTYSANDGSGSFQYYLVYVDLNGDTGPNSPIYTKKKIADIVPFAVTDKYTIIPLGYPQIDTRYLQAQLVIPAQDEDEEDNISDPMPFYLATVKAFGTVHDGDKSVKTSSEPLTIVEKTYTNYSQDDCIFFSRLSPFCVKEADTDPLNILNIDMEEACERSDDAIANNIQEPTCQVRIYEYH